MHRDALADRRMERFAIFRFLLLLGAVLLAALYRTGLPAVAREVSAWFFASVLGGYAISVFLPLACPRPLRRSRFLAGALIAVDVGVETLLIWTTGGVAGVFAPLAFATVFCATTVLGLSGSLATAAGATGGIAIATAFWGMGWIPPQVLGIPRMPAGASNLAVVAHVLAYGMALHAVALLSAGLAGGLQAIRIITAEIIQKLTEGLIAVDGRGRIICVNDEARKLLRHSDLEVLEGRPLETVLRRQTDARIRALLLAAEDRRMELLLEGRDGRVRPVEAKISVLRGPDGTIRSTIGIFSDLTLRKEAERASRRIEKLEELGEMALAIAHEIRNPLASIRGCAEEIARTAPGDGVIPRLVAILCRESDRLDSSIDEFLNLSRLGAIHHSPVELGEVLEDVATMLRNRPEAAQVTIRYEKPAAPARMQGDRASLAQVFLNLGINALEATAPRGGLLEITARPRSSAMLDERSDLPEYADGFEVSFRDTGPGIPKDRLLSIFTPFVSSKPNGTGLGLAIAQRIARAHRGWIEAESEVGRGSTFRVWLPRSERAGGDRATQACAAPCVSPALAESQEVGAR